jgi:hypothetical protein
MIDQGTLYVYGTEGDDQIDVSFEEGQIRVSGSHIEVTRGGVKQALPTVDDAHLDLPGDAQINLPATWK